MRGCVRPGRTAHHAHAFGRSEGVTDWSALGDAVAARGHSRGDALHRPELNDGRDDQGRQEPTRSEPADFGHGESTGVQDL
jgi:hypothetical protein